MIIISIWTLLECRLVNLLFVLRHHCNQTRTQTHVHISFFCYIKFWTNADAMANSLKQERMYVYLFTNNQHLSLWHWPLPLVTKQALLPCFTCSSVWERVNIELIESLLNSDFFLLSRKIVFFAWLTLKMPLGVMWCRTNRKNVEFYQRQIIYKEFSYTQHVQIRRI